MRNIINFQKEVNSVEFKLGQQLSSIYIWGLPKTFWNIILEGWKTRLILSMFVALTLMWTLLCFPATAPRGAFPDDRVIIILVDVGGIGGGGGLIATCLMPKYQSHAQTHAGLAHFPVAEWINLALCECACLFWAAQLLIFFFSFHTVRNVKMSFFCGLQAVQDGDAGLVDAFTKLSKLFYRQDFLPLFTLAFWSTMCSFLRGTLSSGEQFFKCVSHN